MSQRAAGRAHGPAWGLTLVYSWIWRHLPGGSATKSALALALALVVAVAVLLLFVAFPWIEPALPFNDVTVDP